MTQSKTKVIGITGGISTGKSTVTKILRKKGFKVIDADVISRAVLNIDEEAYCKVVKFFSRDILNDDKTINRKLLGEKIFKDKILRKKLNSITHPVIMKIIKEEIDLNYNEDILFLDIPLLIEIYESLDKYDIYIDEIWLIYCDKETQIKRLMKRDEITLESARLKVNAQMDIEEKKKYADKIIYNTKDKEQLEKDIENLLNKMYKYWG